MKYRIGVAHGDRNSERTDFVTIDTYNEHEARKQALSKFDMKKTGDEFVHIESIKCLDKQYDDDER